MIKIATLCFCVCLFSFGLFAQSDELDNMLKEIEKNNVELQAYLSSIESQQLELKTTNNLPDPQAGFYYMPFGNNNTGAYTEFEVSQTIDFPTVYKVRKDWIELQSEQLEIDYNIKRQELLLEAKNHYNHLVYLNKSKQVTQLRLEQANMLFSQIQNLFEKGQIGILESNKAKIVLLQEQFELSSIENDITEVFLMLSSLNGGIEVSLSDSLNHSELLMLELEDIIEEYQSVSPKSLSLTKMEASAQQEIKLNRNLGLPDLTIGANYQGISGESYAGIYGGFSLPLWNNKNKVNAAKANLNFQQLVSTSENTKDISILEKQFNEYQNILTKYNEYVNVFSGLNSNTLLLKSYEMGQISFMEYYTEVKFYNEAEDEMLFIECQLNQLKAEIFKYKL